MRILDIKIVEPDLIIHTKYTDKRMLTATYLEPKEAKRREHNLRVHSNELQNQFCHRSTLQLRLTIFNTLLSCIGKHVSITEEKGIQQSIQLHFLGLGYILFQITQRRA